MPLNNVKSERVQSRLTTAAYLARGRTGFKFTVRKVPGGYRVWRYDGVEVT